LLLPVFIVFPKKQFQALRQNNLSRNFENHLKTKHPNITDEQTETYITKHLQKPEKRLNFSVPCPESKCKYTANARQASDLKKNLLYHVLKNKKHIDKRKGYSEESLVAYVEDNHTQTFIPVQRHLKATKRKKTNKTIALQASTKTESLTSSDNESSTISDQEFDGQKTLISKQSSSKQPPKKKKRIDIENLPDNAYFTITCDYCLSKLQLRCTSKHNLISNFKRHVGRKHQNITVEQTKNYINNYLHKPEQRLVISVHCPESECKHRLHSYRKLDLKGCLSSHIFTQHSKNFLSYSKESILKHVDNNYEHKLIPA